MTDRSTILIAWITAMGLPLLSGCGGSLNSGLNGPGVNIPAVVNTFDADKTKAEGGNVTAQIRLAKDYIYGTGTDVNYGLGMQWLQRAASTGSNEASALIGGMYFWGRGVPRSVSKVYTIEQPLAAKGVPTACFYMGMLYEFGAGVEKDSKEAATWMKRAADGGDPDGLAQMGVLYMRGGRRYSKLGLSEKLFP